MSKYSFINVAFSSQLIDLNLINLNGYEENITFDDIKKYNEDKKFCWLIAYTDENDIPNYFGLLVFYVEKKTIFLDKIGIDKKFINEKFTREALGIFTELFDDYKFIIKKSNKTNFLKKKFRSVKSRSKLLGVFYKNDI